MFCLLVFPGVEKKIGIAVIDSEKKHLTILTKRSSCNVGNFYQAMTRNATPGLLDSWTCDATLKPFDLSSQARDLTENCPIADEPIVYFIILYCLVHECFVPTFVLDDLYRYKITFAYWLAKGNLPM